MLTEEASMLVRKWRNNERVSQYMDFKEQISIEQQKKWFEEIKKSDDFYFTINLHSEPIGLIHLNRIDDEEGSAYAGLFIGSENFEGTGIAFQASILILDFAFNELELVDVFAKVHCLNSAAIDYNKTLGFCADGEETPGFLRLKLEKQNYLDKRALLETLLAL